MNLKDSFDKLPSISKNIVVIVTIIIIIIIFFNTYKWLKKIINKSKAEEEEEYLVNQGVQPTFSDSQYITFANQIQTACDVLSGTDEESIFDVFKKLKNDLDYLKLYTSFGTRRPEFNFSSVDLPTYLRKDLSDEEINIVNAILMQNNITYLI